MSATPTLPATDVQDHEPVSAHDVPGDLELSVVMPCLNEEKTLPICIAKALSTMKSLGINGEVVVADNGSTDNSVAVARQAGAVVYHEQRKGYGSALLRGFKEARGKYLIMGDCDDSYDFTDLERFVSRLRNGADFVIGNRLKGEIKPDAMPWLHRWIGNPVLSWFLNVLFRTGVGDTHCGMRGFTKEAIHKMNLTMTGMEFASEMVIKGAKVGLRIEEIPITLWPDGRDRPPHLRSFRDGWRHLRMMIMFSPTLLFFLPGIVCTVFGFAAIPIAVLAGYGDYARAFGPNFMYAASIISLLGVQLLAFGLLAKVYAQRMDPTFEDPRVTRFLRFFRMEKGLVTGLGVAAVGVVLGGFVVTQWWNTRKIPEPAQLIAAGTLFTIGVQTMFSSLLLGIIDLIAYNQRPSIEKA